MTNLLILLASYIIGMFPSAYIAARGLKKVKIWQVGDRNPGSANVSRNIHPLAGVAVLMADAAKGAAAVFLAQAFATPAVVLWAGLAVVAGHNWPVLFRFRGGRGLATSIGVLLVLMPLPMTVLSLAGILALWWKDNLIITGAVMFAPLPLVGWLFGVPFGLTIYGLSLVCFSGVMHLLTTRRLSKAQRQEALRWR
jgi:acyl phosphate:glycerol-3-phosphate acyltransferase